MDSHGEGKGTTQIMTAHHSLIGVDRIVTAVMSQLDAVRLFYPTRPIVITGPRGSGRSAILRDAAGRASRQGWRVGIADIAAQGTLAAALDLALEDALIECPKGAFHERVSSARRRFVQEAAASPFDLSEAFNHLLPVLAAERGSSRIAIFVDDLHHVTPSASRALLDGLVTMANTGAPVALIPSYLTAATTGSLEVDPELINEQHLRPFTSDDIIELGFRHGLRLDADALDSLLRMSRGNPGLVVAALDRVNLALRPRVVEVVTEAAVEQPEQDHVAPLAPANCAF